MTHSELISYIKEKVITNNGRIKSHQEHKIDENIKLFINNLTINCIGNFSEKIYWILNDITDYPLCYCGNKITRRSNKVYRLYCSSKCVAKDTSLSKQKVKLKKERYGSGNNVNKAKQTIKIRYGRSNYINIKKIKQTKLERYNDENYCNVDKIKQTKLEHYGNETYVNSNKAKRTMIIKYNRISYTGSEEYKAKYEKTCLEKYGVTHHTKSQIYKQNIKVSFLKKYGVENPAQVPEIHEKQQKYRWKDYLLPSGKVIKIQGYENKALDQLLQEYSEDEIITSRKDIPAIWYWNPEDQKKHRYFPDFWIPKDNLIIEVKSEWTYNKQLSLNNLKEQSVIGNGYNFKLLIY